VSVSVSVTVSVTVTVSVCVSVCVCVCVCVLAFFGFCEFKQLESEYFTHLEEASAPPLLTCRLQ